MKTTPGPWRWACDSYGKVQHSRKYDCVYRGDGSAKEPLVTVAARIGSPADARLIASAPEMYAEIDRMIDDHVSKPTGPECGCEDCERRIALLAKIDGTD